MTEPIIKKRKHKKKKIWTEIDEDLLLDIWEQRIEDLRASRQNAQIYSEMSDEMRKMKRIFTVEEIKVKLHNLKCKYTKEKRRAECLGLVSEWPIFSKIHSILSGYNGSTAEILVGDDYDEKVFSSEANYTFLEPPPSPENPLTPTLSDIASSSETSGTSRRTVKRKRKRETLFASILKEYKTTNSTIMQERNHVRKIDLEMLNIEKERNEILKEFVTNAKVFQDDVTQMLKKIN